MIQGMGCSPEGTGFAASLLLGMATEGYSWAADIGLTGVNLAAFMALIKCGLGGDGGGNMWAVVPPVVWVRKRIRRSR